MINTAVVYVHPIKMNAGYEPSVESVSGTYDENAARFISTYKQFEAGHEHDLVVVFTNGWPNGDQLKTYEGVKFRPLRYDGPGWCTSAHRHAAFNMPGVHFAMFSSARTYFVKAGWLSRIMEVRRGHGYGMYGTMTSDEGCRHIRTQFYGFDPAILRRFEHDLESREASRRLESGDWNISKWHNENRMASLFVTWDGCYEMKDWRSAPNIFRKGDQSNLLVRDRHTEIFDRATGEEREKLEKLSDGK